MGVLIMASNLPQRRSVLLGGLSVLGGSVLFAPAGAAGAIAVATSFSILADLVREVGGARVSVTSLAPVGTDLHHFQPRPSEVRGIGGAAVFVINGLGLEGWAERLAEAGGFRGKGVVATKGVKALAAVDSHGHGHGHGHGKQAAADPHAWQDVANVRLYVANIRDGLTAADPGGAAEYAARTEAYQGRLDALDAEIKAMFAPIPRPQRRVVTSHEAFNYYADAYEVDFLAASGLSSHAEPSARAFAALIAQIKRERIKALFLEHGLSPRLVEQLARETGVKIGGTLYADTLSAADGPAATYVEMMRSNTRTIVAALA
jgi:zinc/manganese transport system substrate-binding protein